MSLSIPQMVLKVSNIIVIYSVSKINDEKHPNVNLLTSFV